MYAFPKATSYHPICLLYRKTYQNLLLHRNGKIISNNVTFDNVDYPLIENLRFWDNFDAEKLSPNRKLLHIGTGEPGQIDENHSCGYDKFPLRHSDIRPPDSAKYYHA